MLEPWAHFGSILFMNNLIPVLELFLGINHSSVVIWSLAESAVQTDNVRLLTQCILIHFLEHLMSNAVFNNQQWI